jgi:formate dehydrogenase major subunit/formate dehydrogenase alpha subunit
VAGLATAFGSGAMTNTIDEIEDANTIFVIGSNTTENHPVIGYRVKRAVKKGAKLIVADPRYIELCDYADVFLQLKPGSNIALLNGLAHVIVKEGLADEVFINDRTENVEALKDAVEKYTPEYIETLTGVPAADIVKAARLYAEADAASILYTMGVTQHTTGTKNVLAIANLALLTGNLGKHGSGVNPLRGQNNVQGACDMGALPNVFTGYQQVANDDARKKFAKAWDVKLSGKPGLTVTEMLNSAENKDVRAMYIMGENPFLSDPDSAHVMHCMDSLDFLVVQDIFMTETAQAADVVLPAVSWAEKEGTFSNTERRIQKVNPAIKPRGDAKPDWVILRDIAQKVGMDWNYSCSEDILKEIVSLTPSYAGISYDRLGVTGLHWPCPTEIHPGTPVLHTDKFSRGLGHFTPVEHQDPAEVPDAEYPFMLTTGRILYHYHTGTMTRRSPGLDQIHQEELMELNPADATALGVEECDSVNVISRRGKVRSRIKVTDRVPPGVVFMTFHFKETAVNLLTNSQSCPTAKIPELKVCAVRLEKAE